jgi:predicted dehydrogenase
MQPVFPEIDAATLHRYAVGVIGVGGVASYAHMPAYRDMGVPVVALHDRDDDALARASQAFATPPPCFGALELDAFCDAMARRGGVIDVCTPSPSHLDTVDAILDRLGRRTPALLVQKPLAPTLADARRMVARCEELGVPLAVNLNARWVPAFARTARLVRERCVGDLVAVTLVNRGFNRKAPDSWRGAMPRLVIGEMAVHHLDLLIELLGDPRWVFAQTRSVPGWGVPGESVAHVQIGFADGPLVNVVEDWVCHARGAHQFHPTGEQLLVEGTHGTIVCTPRSVDVWRGDDLQSSESTFAWFPDAFRGPYLHLVESLSRGVPLRIGGADYLRVAALVDAAYESARTSRVISLEGGADATVA